MQLSDLDFLLSERGQTLLSQLQAADLSDKQLLSLVTNLRKAYEADEVSAAIALARLRQKAVIKFGNDAYQMYFTDDALQQASDPLVRHYRTDDVQGLRILDVGCGVGSDSLAFAQGGAIVTGIDLDPLRIEMARLNAVALGIETVEFRVQDATILTATETSEYDLIFFDPARRTQEGNRIYDVEAYLPPLSLVKRWHAARIMVKLAPGVDVDSLIEYNGRVEFISVDGNMKEALLHIGGDDSGVLQATRLTEDSTLNWINDGDLPSVELAAPRQWLCEPDVALLRANLVEAVVAACDGVMLDETIAYFTTDTLPDNDWVRAWRIQDWMPYHLKKLRAYLRKAGVRQVTVKKRGSPITPEELQRQLKLKSGDKTATLVLTRYQGQPIVIICDDITVSSDK